MKIISIVGARPQFIKAVPLCIELRKKFNELLIHTGQHFDYEMSEIFFKQLNIPEPNYNLNIREKSHSTQTGKMLIKIESVLMKEKPSLVIVFGDTNSTLAGALAAAKLKIPVAHIEAGLRSRNMSMPEEINRILTDHTSAFHFVPSVKAKQILKNEGINKNVFVTGDIMYDAILHFGKIAERKSIILRINKLKPGSYILATIHRAENTASVENLKNIFEIFSESGKDVVIPIHPGTIQKLKKYNIKPGKNTKVIKPVSYLDMIQLLKNSYTVLTDSGGVQKEAYYLGVPCITLRTETEWIETVEAGWNIVTGVNKDKVKEAIMKVPEILKLKRQKLYGNGKSASEIVKIISKSKKDIIAKKYYLPVCAE